MPKLAIAAAALLGSSVALSAAHATPASCAFADSAARDARSCVLLKSEARCKDGTCAYFVDSINDCTFRVWVQLDRSEGSAGVSGSLGPRETKTFSLGSGSSTSFNFRWTAMPFGQSVNVVRDCEHSLVASTD